MTLPASDAFTAANGTPLTTYSANWTYRAGTFAINTNACYCSASALDSAAWWNADTFNSNQQSFGTLVSFGAANIQMGVAVRIQTAGVNSYYGFYTDSTGAGTQLFRVINGTWTQLGSNGTVAWSVNDVIKLTAVGTTLTPYRNGAVYGIGAQTDANLSGGNAGITAFDTSTSTRIDNWTGDNYPSFFPQANDPILQAVKRASIF